MISRGKQCTESITILETSMSTHFLSRVAVKLPLAAIALAVSSAYAAPVVGPSDDSFYTQPALGGAKGDLITYRTATVNLGTGAPAAKAWNVIYQTVDSRDRICRFGHCARPHRCVVWLRRPPHRDLRRGHPRPGFEVRTLQATGCWR